MEVNGKEWKVMERKDNKKPANLVRLRVSGSLYGRYTTIAENQLVPEVGVEPTWAQVPLDFESSASTSFTTPALKVYREVCNRFYHELQ